MLFKKLSSFQFSLKLLDFVDNEDFKINWFFCLSLPFSHFFPYSIKINHKFLLLILVELVDEFKKSSFYFVLLRRN
jgi:hypothetical protein